MSRRQCRSKSGRSAGACSAMAARSALGLRSGMGGMPLGVACTAVIERPSFGLCGSGCGWGGPAGGRVAVRVSAVAEGFLFLGCILGRCLFGAPDAAVTHPVQVAVVLVAEQEL